MDFAAFSNFWGYLLIALLFGGSIFVHELGHFLAAKAFGLKVLRFSIGFGPVIAQWRGKDGCKYALSLLPLGGYVAIPQLVDLGKLEGEEDGDAEKTKGLPKAGCMAKICVSAAGAAFNLLLALALALVVCAVGVPEQEAFKTTVVGGLDPVVDAFGNEYVSPAKKAGMREGDKITAVDGKPAENFENIIEYVATGSGRDKFGKPSAKISVVREGKKMDFEVSPILLKTNYETGDEIRTIGATPAIRMIVGEVMPNSPAQKAGLKEGDEVIGVNSKKIYSPSHMANFLKAHPGAVKVDILRGGKKIALAAEPKKAILTKPLMQIDCDKGRLRLLETADKAGAKRVRVFSKSPDLEIEVGDILYEIGSKKIASLGDAMNAAAASKNLMLGFAGENFRLKTLAARGAKAEIIPPQSRVMLGYQLKSGTVISHPSVGRQFREAVEKVFNALESLANPDSDIGIKSLAGPVDIGRVIYRLSSTAVMLVISFTVLLNINLAILNMLPIPVLDGGHIIFAIIEKLRGKPVPAGVFAAVQSVFAALFLALMGYVVYIGFARWSGDSKAASQSEIYSQFYIKTKF